MEHLYNIINSGSVLGQVLEVIPITCLVGLLYIIFRWIAIKRKRASVAVRSELVRLLFVCYLTALCNLLLLPNNLWTEILFFLRNGYSGGCDISPLFSGSFQWIPTCFKVLAGDLTLGSWVITMLVGNILLWIPMGVFLRLYADHLQPRNIFTTAILLPTAIELFQPIIGRSFDTDDIIMNFIGILLGYFATLLMQTLLKKNQPN